MHGLPIPAGNAHPPAAVNGLLTLAVHGLPTLAGNGLLTPAVHGLPTLAGNGLLTHAVHGLQAPAGNHLLTPAETGQRSRRLPLASERLREAPSGATTVAAAVAAAASRSGGIRQLGHPSDERRVPAGEEEASYPPQTTPVDSHITHCNTTNSSFPSQSVKCETTETGAFVQK